MTVLSTRQLNRALLHRQLLLERSSLDLPRVVEAMGGIQMQYAPSGYVGLWARMRDLARDDLTRALDERRVVQGTMLRATIHTVSAEDYWPMMAGIRRANRAWLARAQAATIGGADLDAVAATVRRALADGPLRRADLAARLEAAGYPRQFLTWAGLLVEIVRVPPSGTWERRRADLYGLAEDWIPRVEVAEDDGIELLVRRHLGAFGPAAPKDVASWMGLGASQIRHVLDRMELRRDLRDPGGRALLDLPDAPLPDPGTPAPVRFLGTWEAILLVHARRTAVLPEALRPMIFSTKTPHSFNTVLVDGQVAATWKVVDGELELTPLRPLPAAERREVDAEGERLLAFHR